MSDSADVSDADLVPVSATTTQPINLTQLFHVLASAGSVKVEGNQHDRTVKTITVYDLDQGTLDTRLTSYVYDPTFGVPADRVAIMGLADKAQKVLTGKATFSPAEIQAAIAALVIGRQGQ